MRATLFSLGLLTASTLLAPAWGQNPGSSGVEQDRLFLPRVTLADGVAVVTVGGPESAVGPVVGVNAGSGRVRWEHRTRHLQLNPPAAGHGRAIVRTMVDSEDGPVERWHVLDLITGHRSAVLQEASPGGYFGTAASSEDWLVTVSGRVIDLAIAEDVGALAMTPVLDAKLDGDRLVYLSGNADGELALHDVDLAERVPVSVASLGVPVGDANQWTLLGADETVAMFWQRAEEAVVCIELDSGRRRWTTEMDNPMDAYRHVRFTPQGQALVARPHNHLDAWVFDLDGGWHRDRPTRPTLGYPELDVLHRSDLVTATVRRGTVIVALTNTQRLVCFDAESGQTRWSARVPVEASDTTRHDTLTVGDRYVVVLTARGLFCADLVTGVARLAEFEPIRTEPRPNARRAERFVRPTTRPSGGSSIRR